MISILKTSVTTERIKLSIFYATPLDATTKAIYNITSISEERLHLYTYLFLKSFLPKQADNVTKTTGVTGRRRKREDFSDETKRTIKKQSSRKEMATDARF